jgi:large subunit ribosomal protein L32e
MTTEIKRLIRVRVAKGASFKRDGYGKKRQLSDSWRKPRGQHNKQREQKKAKGALPTPGYGSPIAVRGMHPSGFFEVLVSSVKELEGIDPKTQAVRISGTVGDRKRVVLQATASTAGLKVLNARIVKSASEMEKATPAAKKSVSSKKETKKPATSKANAAPVKKDAAKAEVKKAPAKTAKKTEKPADKPEKKVPAKKAEAKPAAEKATKSAEAKPKAKSSKSGVKKNE